MNSDGQIVAASKPSHFIGKKEDIIQAGRVVKSVGERDVLVLYHQGDFYAIDVRCYREFETSMFTKVIDYHEKYYHGLYLST